jgi:hypothetical protein
MVQKYINYDVNDFSSIWTKVVLPTVKVRWTCWGADMWQQSRIKLFVVKLYVFLDANLLAID